MAYICRFVLISTLVRETSFYSGQWLMSSLITSQSAKHKKLWALSCNESCMLLLPTPPPSHHHQGTLKKSGRKCESWQLRKGAMKCWLLIVTWFCTHQHTVAVVPIQDEARKKITTRMERGPRLYAWQGNIGNWKFLRERESLFCGVMGAVRLSISHRFGLHLCTYREYWLDSGS